MAWQITSEVWVGHTPLPLEGVTEGIMVQHLQQALDVIQTPGPNGGASDGPAVGAVQAACHDSHTAQAGAHHLCLIQNNPPPTAQLENLAPVRFPGQPHVLGRKHKSLIGRRAGLLGLITFEQQLNKLSLPPVPGTQAVLHYMHVVTWAVSHLHMTTAVRIFKRYANAKKVLLPEGADHAKWLE